MTVNKRIKQQEVFNNFHPTPNEEIIWHGKPIFFSFIFSHSLPSYIFLLIGIITLFQKEKYVNFLHCLIPITLLFGLFSITVGLFLLFKRIILFKSMFYVLTNKRIIILSNNKNNRIQFYLAEIKEITLKQNIIEKTQKVGTICFFLGKFESSDLGVLKTYEYWNSIPNHFYVFKLIEKHK